MNELGEAIERFRDLSEATFKRGKTFGGSAKKRAGKRRQARSDARAATKCPPPRKMVFGKCIKTGGGDGGKTAALLYRRK